MLVTLHQNALNCLSDDLHLWWSCAADRGWTAAHGVQLVENNYIKIQVEASLNETSGVQQQKKNQRRLINLQIFFFSSWRHDAATQPQPSYRLRLWAQNCDNWFMPKWQSVESQTTITQSTIIHHAPHHQPARQNVIKTSMSVLQYVWMLLGEETCVEQGSALWVTLHFT